MHVCNDIDPTRASHAYAHCPAADLLLHPLYAIHRIPVKPAHHAILQLLPSRWVSSSLQWRRRCRSLLSWGAADEEAGLLGEAGSAVHCTTRPGSWSA